MTMQKLQIGDLVLVTIQSMSGTRWQFLCDVECVETDGERTVYTARRNKHSNTVYLFDGQGHEVADADGQTSGVVSVEFVNASVERKGKQPKSKTQYETELRIAQKRISEAPELLSLVEVLNSAVSMIKRATAAGIADLRLSDFVDFDDLRIFDVTWPPNGISPEAVLSWDAARVLIRDTTREGYFTIVHASDFMPSDTNTLGA